MRPRRLCWLIFIGVLVLVALIVVVVRPDGEPSYRGRSLSEWVGFLAPSVEPTAAVKEAEEAIRHIGTNALPYLLKWIQYERPPWKNALNRVTGGRLGRYDLLLEYRNDIRARQALEAFREVGPQACKAIPQLIRLMNDPNRSATAQRAAIAIGHMGTNARPELPRFIGLVTDTNTSPWATWLAITALGELKLEPQLVVPALTNCLLSSVNAIRFSAAQALGQFGGEARSAVPALVRALGDPYPDNQRSASNALWGIDPQALERFNARAGEAGKE
jgi:hypothetical protein